MLTTQAPTPADVRARKARLRVSLRTLSERTGYRIDRISRAMNEGEQAAPLIAKVAEALDAIEAERAAAPPSND